MKVFLLALTFLCTSMVVFAAEPAPSRQQIEAAISKGAAYLQKQQQADGSFAEPANAAASQTHPALTALPLVALQGAPAKIPAGVLEKGYDFLRSKVQADGGIYTTGLSNYNTSVSLIALLGTGNPKDEPILTKARSFVANQQASNMAKPEVNGGFGYGPTGSSAKRQHPDLDNTLVSLEALRQYRERRPNVEIPKEQELNFQAAIDFISRCQNAPETNKQAWVSGDDQNKGGFIYYPGASNAGEQELPDGRKALRSYGTMSYAGLLSFIYADLKPEDQRVVAALDWLSRNYTLEENPGMGRQGIYYYYNLAARGLGAAGVKELTLADGRKVDWKAELASKIISLQAGDGSWVNDQARWMEKDSVLVTCYCVLALEQILAK